MLKLFVTAAELSIPLGVLSAVLIAHRSYAPRDRQRVGRWTVAAVAVGVLVSAGVVWLRLNTTHIRLPVINIWVGSALVLTELVFLAAAWLMIRRPLISDQSGWKRTLLTVSALVGVTLINVFYAIPLLMAADGIVPMNGTLFSSEAIINLVGYILGIGLVVLFSWTSAVTLGKIARLPATIIATLAVAVAVISQWAPLYQQYAAVKFVPKSSLNFTMLLFLQRNNTAVLIAWVVLALLPAIIAVFMRSRPPADTATAAEIRLHKADVISRRRFFAVAAGTGVVLAAGVTVGKKIAESVPELSPIEPSVVNGDKVEVNLDAISDGHLHRFAYPAKDGTEVRFIAIQKNASAFGTGLDACEICGPSGYYERDGKVICRKCDVIMNIQTIGFKGGCNPIPIAYELDGGKIKFSVAELEQQAKVFR